MPFGGRLVVRKVLAGVSRICTDVRTDVRFELAEPASRYRARAFKPSPMLCTTVRYTRPSYHTCKYSSTLHARRFPAHRAPGYFILTRLLNVASRTLSNTPLGKRFVANTLLHAGFEPATLLVTNMHAYHYTNAAPSPKGRTLAATKMLYKLAGSQDFGNSFEREGSLYAS